MTVGIGAVCEEGEQPEVVVAADRMVTVGQTGGVEYEDTSTKIEVLLDDEGISAAVVGSGTSTLIDSIIKTARDYTAQNRIETIGGAKDIVLSAYKTQVQESVQNRVLSGMGYKLADFRNKEQDIPTEIQKEVLSASNELRQKMAKQAQILLAVATENNAAIYLIAGNDYSNFSDIGYAIIGSGTDSARLTFIRRSYDSTCEFPESLFTVAEAKSQAEERQGVGQDMDLVRISGKSINKFSNSEIKTIRKRLSDIKTAEMEARQNVITDWGRNTE